MLVLGMCSLIKAVIDDFIPYLIVCILITGPLQVLWDKIMMTRE
jgi:hypothetical protein